MKKKKYILLADHTIGYRIVDYILTTDVEDVEIVYAYTNEYKDYWWQSLHDLERKHNIIIKDYHNNRLLFEDIKDLEIDYILCLSWKHILTKNVLSIPTIGTVNMHYSLLPRHRGVYPVNWAIMSGDNITGVSFHFIGDEIDSGKIIKQSVVPIASTDTSKELLSKLDDSAYSLFVELWNNRDKWQEMNQKSENKTSYHSNEDFIKTNLIELNKQYFAEEFINLLRAKTFSPYKKNVYFIDKQTGKKVYLEVTLESE